MKDLVPFFGRSDAEKQQCESTFLLTCHFVNSIFTGSKRLQMLINRYLSINQWFSQKELSFQQLHIYKS